MQAQKRSSVMSYYCRKERGARRSISACRRWLIILGADLARIHPDDLGERHDAAERRRISSRHEHLGAETVQLVKQRSATARIKMCHHFVKQEHRSAAGQLRN